MSLSAVFQSFDLSTVDVAVFAFCGMLIGAAKTGLAGVGTVAVPLLAAIFGARSSVGILLPVLTVGDIFGVSYYHRDADWKHLGKLLPWAFAGIVIATFTGEYISEHQFRILFAVIVIGGVILMTWREVRHDIRVPSSPVFAAVMGLAGGFTTMIGNAAGPVMALYLLSMRLPKNAYIGTAAWFFMIVNLTKVPFHWFVWGTVTPRTLLLDLTVVPAVALGALLGVAITKRIPERGYRIFIIAVTGIAALKLLF